MSFFSAWCNSFGVWVYVIFAAVFMLIVVPLIGDPLYSVILGIRYTFLHPFSGAAEYIACMMIGATSLALLIGLLIFLWAGVHCCVLVPLSEATMKEKENLLSHVTTREDESQEVH